MRRLPKSILWIPIVILLLAGPVSAPGSESAGRSLKLTPEVIEMRAFYSGARMRIEGVAEAGTKVVIVVRGEDKGETFNKKVRAGPIWISSGKVTISGAPSLFLRFSDEPIGAFLGRAVIDEYGLDEDAIKSRMRVDAGEDEVDEDLMRSNYVAMKAGKSIYQIPAGGITLGTSERSLAPYSVEFDWPKTAPPAEYQVRAYECRDGRVVRESTARLDVVKIGFPSRVFDLAMNRAPQYGLIAIIIAIIAGLGIDFVVARLFGTRRKVVH